MDDKYTYQPRNFFNNLFVYELWWQMCHLYVKIFTTQNVDAVFVILQNCVLSLKFLLLSFAVFKIKPDRRCRTP